MAKLTDIRGVGPSTARKLKRAGYSTVESLRGVAPARLQEIEGIGRDTAQTIAGSATFQETGLFDTQFVSGGTRQREEIAEAEFETESGDIFNIETMNRGGPTGPTRAIGFTQLSINPDRGGEYEHKSEFTRTQDKERAFNIASTFMSDYGKAKKEHEERPKNERAVDEAKSAKLTVDFDVWNKNKDRWDYPGVDSP